MIVRAFLAECYTRSAGATSLSDIASAVGIRKASLYNHFTSRDAIVADALRWCGETLPSISFVPDSLDSVAPALSARTLLFAVAERLFRMFSRPVLAQAFSFVESERFFSDGAEAVARSFRAALVSQVSLALDALARAGKVRADAPLGRLAECFALSLASLLADFVAARKAAARSGCEVALSREKLGRFVSEFCSVL